jgi:hypothetical protein
VMRPLAVTFVNTGELGSDAGALKREFFWLCRSTISCLRERMVDEYQKRMWA